MCKYVYQKRLDCYACRQEASWCRTRGEYNGTQGMKHASKGSTLALKFIVHVTRSPKTGVLLALRKVLMFWDFF